MLSLHVVLQMQGFRLFYNGNELCIHKKNYIKCQFSAVGAKKQRSFDFFSFFFLFKY